jgi:hypothetical protein
VMCLETDVPRSPDPQPDAASMRCSDQPHTEARRRTARPLSDGCGQLASRAPSETRNRCTWPGGDERAGCRPGSGNCAHAHGRCLLLAVAEPGAAVTSRSSGRTPRVTRGASAAPSTSRATGKTSSPTSWMALRAGGRSGVRGATRGGRGSNADLGIRGLLSQVDVHDVIRGVVDVHGLSRNEVAL